MDSRGEGTGFPFLAAFFVAMAGILFGVFICLIFWGVSAFRSPFPLSGISLLSCGLGLCIWLGIYFRRGRRIALFASLPYCAFLIPVFFFPDYILGEGPRLVVSFSIIAITALCYIVMVFLVRSSRVCASEGLVAKSSMKIIAVACVLFIGIAVAYGITRYLHFGYSGMDLGLFIQSYWTALRGKLFWNTHEFYPGGSRFGKHFSPIMFLILLFFSLYPHFVTLLLLYAICLGLGGIVVYFLARDSLGGYGGLCFGLSFLLYPGIAYQVRDGYYMMHYTPLFLLLSMYYFRKEKLGLFCFFLILTLCAREDIALTTFFFGVYAVIRRRGAAWVLIPTILSAVWFGVAMGIIIPAFGTGTMWEFYEDTGGSLGGVVSSFLQNPIAILLRFLSPAYIKLLYLILMPLAIILPLLGSEIIFVLPTLLIIGLSSMEQTRSIYGYYYMPLIPFIFASSITAVKKLSSSIVPGFIQEREKVNLLCTFVLFLSLAVFVRGPLAETLAQGITRPYNVRSGAGYNETLRKVIGLVPSEASVFTPRYLKPHLARRMFVTSEVPFDVEYLIIDSNTEDPRTARIQKGKFIKELAKNPDYVKLFDEKGVKLYHKISR